MRRFRFGPSPSPSIDASFHWRASLGSSNGGVRVGGGGSAEGLAAPCRMEYLRFALMQRQMEQFGSRRICTIKDMVRVRDRVRVRVRVIGIGVRG